MKKIILLLTLLLMSQVHAADIVANPILGLNGIDRATISELFTGISNRINGEVVTLYVLPLNHPVTRETINELDINYFLLQKLLSKSALVDRDIYIKKTEIQVVVSVASDFVGVGYVNDADEYYLVEKVRITD